MPKQEKVQQNPQQTARVIHVERMDVSNFDDSYSFLKEKFNAEMKRLDNEMTLFTHVMKNLYGTPSTHGAATDSTTAPENRAAASNRAAVSSATWESLANSPLIHGEGADKFLKLQFDMSAFDPAEVKVEFNGDLLIVSAQHQEESDGTSVHRDFRREFLLPREINAETMVSSITRDGVLTVQVPLVSMLTGPHGKDDENVLSKQGAKKTRAKKLSVADDPRVAPGAPPSNLVPQSPMSSISPVSAEKSTPSKVSTQILHSQDTSKQSSKIKPQVPQPK